MEFIIKARNVELTDEIRQRAEKKIKNNILKYFDKVIKIEAAFSIEKNPKITLNNIVEVTVFTPGEIIRTKAEGFDMFEAIDKANAKLERQIKKYRDKMIHKGRNHDNSVRGVSYREVEEDIKDQIVKVKTFTIKPITPEEAVMQMELLGHDFFVFINSESNATAVVYKRKDKNYGLIEPNI
ncbi:MAG: ribosome-associated translation inhibitor RaiA [Actinobacteria bacterium]|nr:ribosome-associated translation inhibitor RaiA [Actinomycetota bacterium]